MHRLIDAVTAVATDPALRRRLQYGFLWNVIAAVFNQGSTFLLSLVIANVLGRERFGVYALIQSTLSLLGAVAQLAMGITTTKYVAELRSSAPERVGRVVAMCATIAMLAGLTAAAGAWTFAPAIARFLEQPAIAPLIRLGAVIVVFVCISGVCTGALAGFERFRTIAVVGFASGALYIAGGTLGAMRWQLTGAVAAIAIVWGVQTLLLAAALLRAMTQHSIALGVRAFREIALEKSILLTFALPSALIGFTVAPTVWIVTAILARQPRGITEVALFSASNSMRVIALLLPLLLNSVGFSLLNNAYGRRDGAAYRRIFFVNLTAVTTMALAAMAVLMLASPWALRAFGRSFLEGRGALLVLLASTPVEALGSAMNLSVQAHGRMWATLLGIALPRDSSIVAAALLLVPRYGAVGAGFAFLIGATVALVSVLVLARRTAVKME